MLLVFYFLARNFGIAEDYKNIFFSSNLPKNKISR
jgi:hypothetical protein